MTSQDAMENRFHLFYETSPNLLCTLDDKGIIMDVNQRTLEYFGYSKKELIGRSCFDFIASNYKKTAMEGFNEMKVKEIGPPIELLLIRKDKTTFYSLCRGAALRDKRKNFLGYIITIQDISQIKEVLRKEEENRKNLEIQYDELRKIHETFVITEKKYRDLYENSPDLLRSINSDGIIIDCNKSYAKSLDYTKKEIIGKSIFEHTAERSREELREGIEEWQKTGKISNKEIWLQRKGGSIFPTLLSGTNLYDENENIVGRTVSLRDISELYLVRQEVERSHEKIRKQFEELKRLDQKKDEFLAMITHELKTPLVPIKGYIELLLSEKFGPLTQMQKEKISIIKHSTDVMLKLVSDLLDVQKIELGELRLEKKRHDLVSIIQETIRSIMQVAEQRRIEMISELDSQAVPCLCDKIRIEQVLANLINNAMNFCPKNGGRIMIKLSKKQEANIIIEDNGVGISKNNLNKIFVKFYQVDTSSTREHTGTGLGLAICKGIIENHGGKIWAESEGIGKGCKINISLPLA